MIGALQKLLRTQIAADTPTADEHLVPAAAAMLLFEVAWADHSISESEVEQIRLALRSQFGLAEILISDIVQDAKTRHAESVGVYEYTRTLNESLAPAEKFELLVALWRLALSDATIHELEEHVIRKLSELLYVPHGRFIAAKQAARELMRAEGSTG